MGYKIRAFHVCVVRSSQSFFIEHTKQEPGRMALAIVLMESAVEAVEGRLKSPVKKQGVICRTLLKALLMECFAWLPPGSFPGSSTRLFKVHPLVFMLRYRCFLGSWVMNI